MSDDSNSTLKKEAVKQLLRLAKSELDAGRAAMASRLLTDAIELIEEVADLDLPAHPGGSPDAVSPYHRKN